MANVRQYFDSDFKGFFWYEGPVPLQINGTEVSPSVIYRILHHHDSRASCVAFYVPSELVIHEICKALIDARDWWMNVRNGLTVFDSTPGLTPEEITRTIFTGRIAIYIEGQLPTEIYKQLIAYALVKGVDLMIRDQTYAEERDEIERPHAFISHDFRDKGAIARPLATTLSRNLCRVWYDEFSLNIGDSLRATIEDGLKRCHKCVLVLTPNFLGNARWAKRNTIRFLRERWSRKNN